MTPQRLRNKMRKIRAHGEEMAEEGGELNLVPYLDIVTNVIMFMLATTSFAAALGDINVSAPTTSTAVSSPTDTPPPPKNDLNLTVSVSDKGFTIAASGAVLYQGFSFDGAGNLVQPPGNVLPTVPKKADGSYDYDLLAKKMKEIKGIPTAAGETKVIINANANILYEVVVATLDACRGKLIPKADPANPGKMLETWEGFGDVLLSAGVN
jgi:biopolymer transport protein ExbD